MTSNLDMFICMGYWPSVRSRWLDIGQVLFFCVALLKLKTKSAVVSLTTNEIRSTDQNHVEPIKNNEQLLSSYQLQIVTLLFY